MFSRFTLAVVISMYSLLNQITGFMEPLNKFMVCVGFWLVFWWWFNSVFVTKEDVIKLLQQNIKENKNEP